MSAFGRPAAARATLGRVRRPTARQAARVARLAANNDWVGDVVKRNERGHAIALLFERVNRGELMMVAAVSPRGDLVRYASRPTPSTAYMGGEWAKLAPREHGAACYGYCDRDTAIRWVEEAGVEDPGEPLDSAPQNMAATDDVVPEPWRHNDPGTHLRLRQWINEDRTVLVRHWYGVAQADSMPTYVEVATRPASWHSWGPPVRCKLEFPA